MNNVIVSGSFDDLRSRHVRLLDEASKLGDVHLLLWADDIAEKLDGKKPKFPVEERLYFVDSIRYVSKVTIVSDGFDRDSLPAANAAPPAIWAVDQSSDNAAKQQFVKSAGLSYRVITDEQLKGFPIPDLGPSSESAGKKKIIATGCYDWLHTGHVRFFEEVSEYGDLYVAIGHDANIELLKGPGHPLFREQERRYMVQAIRFVKQALVTSGQGWLDAEPEIERLKPDVYAVNEDGDKPEKKNYCQQHGIEYLVLKRLPKPGLTRRQSTALRGF